MRGTNRSDMRTLGFAISLIAGAGLLACGDGAGPEEDTVADCIAAAGVTGPAVGIRDFSFTPGTLTVEPGTTVTWVNCEGPGVDAHTTTSDEGLWDSDLLSQGEVFTRRFDDVGEFPYHCVPHPVMQAVIVVEEPA